jgi:hypothetical protein
MIALPSSEVGQHNDAISPAQLTDVCLLFYHPEITKKAGRRSPGIS